MKRVWLLTIVVLALAGWLSAEMLVEIYDRPLVAETLEGQVAASGAGGAQGESSKSYGPSDQTWIVPFFLADMTEPGDTTYISVRNDDVWPVTVHIQYTNIFDQIQTSQSFELVPHQLVAVSLRDIEGLLVDGDGYARGSVFVTSTGPVYVDSFHLESRNSFAVGGEAFLYDEFCIRWNARFLRFAGEGGTRLVVFMHSPWGSDPSDPASVFGNVYAENGDFINSFEIRTDEHVIEFPVQDYVLDGIDFGTVELTINSELLPGGLVEIRHRALGEYSLGHLATCAD